MAPQTPPRMTKKILQQQPPRIVPKRVVDRSSVLGFQRYKPFPRLPAELVQHIIVCGADTVGLSAVSRPGDERGGAAEAAHWLSTCCLVCSDWLSIARPLLFAHVSLGTIPSCHLFLRSLACPLPPALGGRPLWALVHTFTYAAWSPALEDGSAAPVEYSEVVSLRKAVLKYLFLGSTTSIIFPTVTYPLLDSLVTNTDEIDTSDPRAPTLRGLGTVLAVENAQLSRILAAPAFGVLEHLSIWYGDPATGSLCLPPTLRSLAVRCDHFHQGCNIPFPALPPGSGPSTHLPLLKTLRFEFTTRRYPEASPWGPIPLLLSAVGSTVTRLGLACDRGSAPANQTLDPLALAMCPQLEILELTNHRLAGPDGSWAGIEHRRVTEIHYRLDGARPFALAPPIPVTRALTGPLPAGLHPPIVDSLALAEIGSLLRSPKHLMDAFPTLRTLSIGRLPSAASVARSGPHVWSQLVLLASLPRLAAAAGVSQVVEVTDEWHRPLGALLAARATPFIGRSLEVEPIPTTVTTPPATIKYLPATARASTTAGPRRSLRLASKSGCAQASTSPEASGRASTTSPTSSIEPATPNSSTGGSSANGHRLRPAGSSRKSTVQNHVELGAVLVAGSSDDDDSA